MSASLDSAVIPLYWTVLGAFAACSMGVVLVARRGAAHEPVRGRVARLELTWTLLTGALVFALAGGTLSRQHAGPVRLAALADDDKAAAKDADDHGKDAEDAKSADEGTTEENAAADGEIATAPDEAAAGTTAGDAASLPTDEEPAATSAIVE
ncbi:MAG: hypothetical protein U0610_23560 [bacterium]